MEQSGEYLIAASPEVVWQGLNDPEVLGQCIPGCLEINRVSDTAFVAKVKAKIGPVSATFDANLELEDLNPPHSYTITGGVKGGAAGFGKGQAQVQLAPVEGETQLRYQVSASVGGKLAQVGNRLVDGAARKMAEDFFRSFRDHVSAPAENLQAEPGPSSVSEEVETGQEFENEGNQFVWIVAFVVLGLAMLLAI